MAQFSTFYENHKTHGLEFKRLIVLGGRLDRKLGFPIHQIHNTELLARYDSYLKMRAIAKTNRMTAEQLNQYQAVIQEYKVEVRKYHIERASCQQ